MKIWMEKTSFDPDGNGSVEVRRTAVPDVDLEVGVAAGCGVV